MIKSNTVGSIPKTMRVWLRKKDEKGNIPAFPVDADNAKTNETAERWANGYGSKATSIEWANEPFIGVKIMDIESRERSGNVFKALVKGNYLVDFRDPVLFDAINSEAGIRNGEILAPVMFARVNAEMRLILVDSEVHKELLALDDKKALKNIGPKDLIVGHVYSTATGPKEVYLGKFKHFEIEAERYCYGETNRTYKKLVIEDAHFFVEICNWGDKQTFTASMKSGYYFRWKKTPSFKIDHGPVNEEIPTDLSMAVATVAYRGIDTAYQQNLANQEYALNQIPVPLAGLSSHPRLLQSITDRCPRALALFKGKY